jgi:hypothetical protein
MLGQGRAWLLVVPSGRTTTPPSITRWCCHTTSQAPTVSQLPRGPQYAPGTPGGLSPVRISRDRSANMTMSHPAIHGAMFKACKSRRAAKPTRSRLRGTFPLRRPAAGSRVRLRPGRCKRHPPVHRQPGELHAAAELLCARAAAAASATQPLRRLRVRHRRVRRDPRCAGLHRLAIVRLHRNTGHQHARLGIGRCRLHAGLSPVFSFSQGQIVG